MGPSIVAGRDFRPVRGAVSPPAWCAVELPAGPFGAGTRRSDLRHLEVFLARAAFRARPVDGHVFPARTRGDALFRQPCLLVVDPTANQAHPAFVFHLFDRVK